MNDRRWNIRIIVRYALLQLPGLAIFILILMLARHWIAYPLWFGWLLVVLWIVKDIIFYPIVWRSYDWEHADEKNSMIGKMGIVETRLDPSGYIRIRGELWQAEAIDTQEPVEKGEPVIVHQMRGLTLLVTSADNADVE
ncbi:MAG: hypothetical protein JW920_01110 [Deltaproteobacteria bacterium]|nr:hypothetical protein [Deltaproteobacteria bacterium]